MDTWLIWMIAGATVGGSIIGFLGWAKQKPRLPLDWIDVGVTALTSLIAGAIYAVTLATPTGNFTKDVIISAVFGAGGDMALRGIAGTVNNLRPPSPPTTPPTPIMTNP